MKKLLIACLMFFAYGANAAEYFDTEKRFYFSVEVVQRAIVDHVPEKNQVAVSTLYDGLIGKEGTEEEGKVSVADLFRVCEAAGFNTRKYEGFSLCKSFIQQMLIDAGKVQCGILQEQMLADIDIEQCLDLGGFCPKNVTHGLRSINHETRIGDFCSSSNIRGGQVIFRKNFESCTCEAYMCNPGYVFDGGACKSPQPEAKDVACEREAWPKTNENNYYAKCKEFCAKKYAGKGCKYTSVVMSHSTNQCICNADSDEVNAALESMRQAKEKQIKNLKYYNVCGKDKGKTGGTEKCVEDFADGGLFEFKWGAKVTVAQAVVLAKEWARIKNNDSDIVCNENFVNCKNNDDCMQCTSLSKNNFYEFRFGSLEELNDLEMQKSIVRSVCTLYGLNYFDGTFRVEDLHNVYYSKCTDASKDKCMNVHSTMMAFGYTAEFEGRGSSGICKINFGSKNSEASLNRYGNLDNFVFCDGIQLSQSNTIDGYLEQWVRGQGISVSSFKCDAASKIYTGDGCKADSTNHDEILTCYINDKPFDFVFDDLNDDLQRKHNAGMQILGCVASGGTYNGENCFLPDEDACIKLRDASATACPNCSQIRWDDKNNLCIMPSVGFNNNVEFGIQIGTSLVVATLAAVPAAAGGAVAGATALVLNIAPDLISTGATMYISDVVDKFFVESKQCTKTGCATDLFGKNFQRMTNFINNNSLTDKEAKMADEEMARLAGLVDNDFIAKIVLDTVKKDPGLLMLGPAGWALYFANRKVEFVQIIATIGTFLSFLDLGDLLTNPTKANVAVKNMTETLSRIGDRASDMLKNWDDIPKGTNVINTLNDVIDATVTTKTAVDTTVSTAETLGDAMFHVVDGAQKD